MKGYTTAYAGTCPISVIVLCTEVQKAQDVCDTVNAVLAQKACTDGADATKKSTAERSAAECDTPVQIAAECIVADAAGGLYEILQGQQEFHALLEDGSVRFADISEAVYETMAQVKNEAVKLASYDMVLMLTAGTKLSCGALYRLASRETDRSLACFERLVKKNDTQFSLFAVSRNALSETGGWNGKLSGGEDYELLLRMCSTEGDTKDGSKRLLLLEEADETKPVYRETYLTYAYVLGKYKERLRQSGLFDAVFTARYEEAASFGIRDYFVRQTEAMLTESEEFFCIDRESRPIFILKGQDVCYGVLDVFADAFAKALRQRGQFVQTIDLKSAPVESLTALFCRPCRAIVGFQSAAFTEQLQEGILFGNRMNGPKFNFIFDHPLYVSYHLMMPLKNYYVLAQDSDYAAYVKQYLENVKNAWHLPPAGQQGSMASGQKTPEKQKKQYGISFIGTYNNYRDRLAVIRQMNTEDRKRALCLLKAMRQNPNLPIEEVFLKVLEDEGNGLPEKREFAVKLHKMMDVGRTMIFYYREKVVCTLLAAGIELHVFSDSWKNSPPAKFPNLIIHENVSYEESLNIMAKSRLSLNVMSWHKGGMTERIANAMLNGSVCVTDWTHYLERHFCDGEDIVLFRLERIEELPERIKMLLAPEHTERVEQIAARGFANAWENHRWKNRADDFMKILEELEQ